MMFREHDTVQSSALDLIRKHLGLEHIWIVLAKEWASSQPNFRQSLRKSLAEQLVEMLKERKLVAVNSMAESLSEIVHLSDLNQIPNPSFAHVSISHCPTIGGFALTPVVDHVTKASVPHIGFDLEDADRVKSEVIARVCENDELEQATDAASLWVAKEASFKATFSNNQPTTVSDISISHWQQIKPEFETFQFNLRNSSELRSQGRGCVLSIDRLKVGFAVF